MTSVFLKLVNMSIASAWLVLAVILLRLLLKNAPKKVSFLLWAVVAVRLLVPITLESPFSLIPSGEVVPQDIAVTQTPAINTGIPVVNNALNPLFTTLLPEKGVTPEDILSVATVVWLIGLAGMLMYAAFSMVRLRWRVRVSVLQEDRCYLSDGVASPFILGILRPRIYLPADISREHIPYVLAHERVHIGRKDHWWKPLGFLLLSLHWFNPVLWIGYILLCRDIEQACDQEVISQMDTAEKKHYIDALVSCAVRNPSVMVCPVAFGEVGVKSRVKGIVRYKKPAFWLLLASVAVCFATAGCFLTNPQSCSHIYVTQLTVSPTCTAKGVQTHTCKNCRHSYTTAADTLAHTFRENAVILAPTCTQTGILEYVCADCDARKTEVMDRLSHTDGELICTKEPNCTESGELSTTCTQCQAMYVVKTLEPNDVHDLQERVLRESTCTNAGSGIKACSRCNYTETCTYELREHDYKQGVTIPGCCIVSEMVQHTCTVCGFEDWLPNGVYSDHAWWTISLDGERRCFVCFARSTATQKQTTSTQTSNSIRDGATGEKPKTSVELPVVKWDIDPWDINPELKPNRPNP